MGILKEMFGPNREDIWLKLSQEIGAEYKNKSFWKSGKVEARVKEWTITLDTYVVSTGQTTVPFTRIRAPYVNVDGFRFTIYRSSYFSEIAKFFGMQDIKIGHPDFDRDFVIKANNEYKVIELLNKNEIRHKIQSQKKFYLTVKDDEGWFKKSFPDGVDELYFQVPGIIKDIERLKTLYELFADILHYLCHIGSAYETDPKVTLS